MRFVDRGILLRKHNALQMLRNTIRDSQPAPIPLLFSVPDMFIGLFFHHIANDVNTKEILHKLASANDMQLNLINRLLTFWWFWSLDRYFGKNTLNMEPVKKGFLSIYGLSEIDLEQTAKHFDEKQPFEVRELWNMICGALCDNSLSPMFAFVHLDSAQTEILHKFNVK